MSLQLAAQHLASHGRGNDNMLVHMTPSEVNKLQQLAMAHGGSLTINPHTGLVEAGFLENLLKSLVPMALGAFLGPAGAGIGGGLFESALGAAGAVGLGTAAVTGDLGKGLSAGLSAYGGAELGGSLMGMGSTTIGAGAVEAAKAAALEKGLTGEAYNQFIQQSVTDEIGKASLFDKLGAGAKTIANDPTNAGFNFLKQNATPLMAAAAPILADEMVETSTDMPKLESSAALTPYTYDPTTQKYKALPSTKLAEGGATMPKPNTDFDVLKAYDEMFGKSKNVKTTTEMPTITEMPNKSQRAYDYLMGRGDYNPTTLTAPVAPAITPPTAPTSSPGDGYYEYDPATQSYKWHPKAAEATKEIAKVVEEQQRGGGNPADRAAAMGSSVSNYAPDVNSYSNGLVHALLNPVANNAPIVDTTGYKSVAEAEAGQRAKVLNAINNTDFSGMDRGSVSNAANSEGPPAANPMSADPSQGGPRGNPSSNSSGSPSSGGAPAANPMGRDPAQSQGQGEGGSDARGGFLKNGKFDQRYAYGGGITALADGGMYNLGSYSDGGRLLRGPGDGVSDSIPAFIGRKQPARLADGEFVVPARIVSELGNGSTEAGARKLYAMMDRIQNARKQTVGKGRVAANSRSEKYLPR
jgi:hypothetical protein